MKEREDIVELEKEWIKERHQLGEKPGGRYAERIEAQRGRKLRRSGPPDNAPKVEDLIDQLGD